MSAKKILSVGSGFACLLVLALPAMAGNGIIYNGVDVWQTSAGGKSFIDFARNPLPAGFFCSGSAAFSGRIAWKGVPLATSPADVFGAGADTVIRRLDDAVLDRGVATTRLQVAALSLASVAPIKTSCGLYDVRAALAPGVQPTTSMRIVRTRKHGGYFEAPLAFNVRLTFTPVKASRGEILEIDRTMSFPAAAGAEWTDTPRSSTLRVKGFALVDTDGDGTADTFLPGTSNFFPTGQRSRSPVSKMLASSCFPTKTGEVCHWDDIELKCHCTSLLE